jgi:hypothetical protein
MTRFSLRLEELTNRVDQILRYHRIDTRTIGSNAIVAHFASWAACEAMLLTAAERKLSGIKLWAGDANCLNDPLEGRALIKFAEDILKVDLAARATGPRPSFGGWPHSISQPWLIQAPAENLPLLVWRQLNGIIHGLYAPPPPSATGWYEPRAVPSSEIYLVSFCNDKDRLDLWRPYGDDGKGVCMVMPLEAAAKLVANTKWTFYRVMYSEPSMLRAWILLETPLIAAWQESKRLPANDQTTARKKILDTVSSVLHLYKHHQFETENEIRLIYRGRRSTPRTENVRGDRRPVLDTDAFFLKGSACQIILGPKTLERSRRIASLQVLLRQVFKRDMPQVQISGVPYQ